jgi:hypothetical protein
MMMMMMTTEHEHQRGTIPDSDPNKSVGGGEGKMKVLGWGEYDQSTIYMCAYIFR